MNICVLIAEKKKLVHQVWEDHSQAYQYGGYVVTYDEVNGPFYTQTTGGEPGTMGKSANINSWMRLFNFAGSIDYSRTFAGILTEYRVEAMGTVEMLEEENGRLMKDIIADETSAYILDKAEELGVVCRVRVTAWAESGDYPVPDGVEITGDLTQGEQAALTRVIAADLAIPAERQHYVEDVE